jgi:2-keto-3-deoxy-L-rhamnonate aldolase RhmA
MSLNRVKPLLRSGVPAFGAIVTMPSPQVVQVLARSGFDLWYRLVILGFNWSLLQKDAAAAVLQGVKRG